MFAARVQLSIDANSPQINYKFTAHWLDHHGEVLADNVRRDRSTMLSVGRPFEPSRMQFDSANAADIRQHHDVVALAGWRRLPDDIATLADAEHLAEAVYGEILFA